ncbi:MucR family transcriptional regulator [Sphingobium sp. H39-3-25]|uniref:MucR family transcriptional regulator n=1 Tax=Sphingobium arseniciresistens TaxID=3030834 RepID=UPI0023B8B52C|nr:MucR family transcriptional regulator [Sphingobium arseniciresistens]
MLHYGFRWQDQQSLQPIPEHSPINVVPEIRALDLPYVATESVVGVCDMGLQSASSSAFSLQYLHLEPARAESVFFFQNRVRNMTDETQNDITTLTVQLLSAYVSRNTVPSENLADLIKTTRAALTGDPVISNAEPEAETFTSAVSVRKSLASPDHILSLIDGKPYKTLKRHLATHGLTPEQYRERYKLPKNYPLVAQSYSEARRAVAAKLGLGKKPAVAASAGKAADPMPVPTDAPLPKAATSPKTAKKSASGQVKKSAKAETVAAVKPPVAEADAANMATPKPAVATKKASTSKDGATPKPVAIISNRAARADIAPAVTKTATRKRLSISAPQKADPEAKAAATPKVKPGRKPKASKALEATDAPEAAATKA